MKMGLFSKLFKKKDEAPAFTKQPGVRKKKFDFNYTDAEALKLRMQRDASVIEGLTPANYYKSKSKYTQAILYYLPDYSYIMANVDSYVDDEIEDSTGYFEITFDTMKKLCVKFGQHLDA